MMDGIACDATQELGGREPQGVMERAYNDTRPEEVALEMRGAWGRARATLSVQVFV